MSNNSASINQKFFCFILYALLLKITIVKCIKWFRSTCVHHSMCIYHLHEWYYKLTSSDIRCTCAKCGASLHMALDIYLCTEFACFLTGTRSSFETSQLNTHSPDLFLYSSTPSFHIASQPNSSFLHQCSLNRHKVCLQLCLCKGSGESK